MKTITTPWQLNHIDKQLIDLAFAEDVGPSFSDVTSALLFPNLHGNEPVFSTAKIISKHPEPILLCGLPVVKEIFAKLYSNSAINTPYKDGDTVLPNGTLLTLNAPAHTLLMAERVLLNFLQRLCAIATTTAKYVKQVSHTKARILDTRKTLPGLRHLEKYAVTCGGGVNHRMGLYDAIMLKDTHIDTLGSMAFALNKLPEDIKKSYPVIVEVRDIQELKIVLELGRNKVTRVLLDNMSPELMQECAYLCDGIVATEASGNIDLTNISIIAETGVDFISVGKLTHSASNVDLSMRCEISHA